MSKGLVGVGVVYRGGVRGGIKVVGGINVLVVIKGLDFRAGLGWGGGTPSRICQLPGSGGGVKRFSNWFVSAAHILYDKRYKNEPF